MADRNICNVELLNSMSENTNVIIDENGVLKKLNLYNEISAISTSSVGGDTLPVESQFYWDKDEEIPDGYVEATPPFSNPNLLINGDFQIWQRGTVDSGNNTYSPFYVCDRWQAYSNSDSMYISNSRTSDGYMQVQTETTDGTGTCTLRYINEHILPSNTYTLSFEVGSVGGDIKLYIFDGTNRKMALSSIVSGINTVTFTGTFHSIDFFFYSTTTTTNMTLKWVKLECGSIATPFVPKQYAEELALCQRYAYSYHPVDYTAFDYFYNTDSTNTTTIGVPLTVEMRVTPTILYKNGTIQRLANKNSQQTANATAIEVDIANNQTFKLKLTFGTNMPTSSYMEFYPINNFKILLDAEIY